MRNHDPTVVLLPIESPTVSDFDRYADRILEEVDAIPLDRPLSKAEQVAWAWARAWKDNPHRRGFGAGALNKAA